MTSRQQRNNELIAKAADGCSDSRDKLIVDNGGLVTSAVEQVLRTYTAFRYYRDELLGTCFVRLVTVVDRIIKRTDLHNEEFNFAAYVHRALENAAIKEIKNECPSVSEPQLPTMEPLTPQIMDTIFDESYEYDQLVQETIEDIETRYGSGDTIAKVLEGYEYRGISQDLDITLYECHRRCNEYIPFFEEHYLAS